jgi:acyl-CoA dehydrogenase
MSELQKELADLIGGVAAQQTAPIDGDVTPLWETVCDLGLAAVGLSEEAGGSGGDFTDLLTVITELAYAGIATPIPEASTAAAVLQQPPTATGFATVAVAPTAAILDGQQLTGEIPNVGYGALAARLVVVFGDVHRVVVVDGNAAGRSGEHDADLAGRPTSTLRFRGTPVHQLPPSVDAEEVLARLGICRTAEIVGHARAGYDLTRGYVRQRVQFGAPLVDVPAVAAGLARMSIHIRQGQATLHRAAGICSSATADQQAKRWAVAVSRCISAEVATVTAQLAHQLHGAVGVTREYPLHRHTRALWSGRDADEPVRDHSAMLGHAAATSGEDVLWEELTG